MDERTGPKHRGNASRSPSSSTLVTAGVGGTILLLGAAAMFFLTRASPEALAITTSVALITGLACLVAITYLVAGRPLPGDNGGGPDSPPPRPATVRSAGDTDAELLRILDDARLGDLTTPLARHRRPGSSDAGIR